MSDAVIFENVNIVFGNKPKKALPLMKQGISRADIHDKTGQTLGVQGCDLRVKEGEVLVLMGLSGSGKSTLLRSVNGLSPVVEGEVHLKNGDEVINVTDASPKSLREVRRSLVTMVFQHFGLLPWRTVEQNVGLGLELAGVPKSERAARIEEQLKLVGLEDCQHRGVHELSGGMQQRVGLARAFATDAPILLMDEPFSALDPLIRTHLQDALLELQKTLRRTIIFVSHDLDEAFKIGDRIAIMQEGQIVQCGTPQEIMQAPATSYVEQFVAHMNPLSFLKAGDVMQSVNGYRPKEMIDASAPLRDALELLESSGEQIGVRHQNTLAGVLDSQDIMRVLSKKGGL